MLKPRLTDNFAQPFPNKNNARKAEPDSVVRLFQKLRHPGRQWLTGGDDSRSSNKIGVTATTPRQSAAHVYHLFFNTRQVT